MTRPLIYCGGRAPLLTPPLLAPSCRVRGESSLPWGCRGGEALQWGSRGQEKMQGIFLLLAMKH